MEAKQTAIEQLQGIVLSLCVKCDKRLAPLGQHIKGKCLSCHIGQALAAYEAEKVTVDAAKCDSVQEFVDKLNQVKAEQGKYTTVITERLDSTIEGIVAANLCVHVEIDDICPYGHDIASEEMHEECLACWKAHLRREEEEHGPTE